ncbi:MAG: DEAD/DEAH box helicase [Ilumatobacteraceae bacterium]
MNNSEGVDCSAFADLGLRDELVRALVDLGYEEPTPIQREAIPHLLAGHDVLGQAATGTGKTAAFALPLLHALDGASRGPVALVLVPTRELAMQVSEAVYKYGHHLRATCVPVYGGQPIGRQIEALKRGAHIVVATPGRALDHLRKKTLKLDDVRTVVLDEADEMLDMGFAEDLEAILESTPAGRQTVLFSATMPPKIDKIARKHLSDPVRVTIEKSSTAAGTTPKVKQSVYVVNRFHKAAALGRILDIEEPEAAIVFCRTRGEVDQLTETLNGRGYRSEALHGGMDQETRDRVMARVRARTAELLIATDVAARGLDIEHLTHVVNYDVPSAPESYVHRIGRVGRAGREGTAITLAEPREQRLLHNIERLTRQAMTFERVPSPEALRAKRMQTTVESLRDAIGVVADDHADVDEVLAELLSSHSIEDIARAAVKLAHDAEISALDESDIPDLSHTMSRDGKKSKKDFGDRPGRTKTFARAGGQRNERLDGRDLARLYVSVGRRAGVRPGDLVGAIANESGVPGRDIGVRIFDSHSVVEVPAARAEHVIRAMKQTSIRGKRAMVRLYRDER